jgi:hypothetical protein
MHLVQQITPFTCGLACIESFTTDEGKAISQSALLTRYKGLLLQTIPKTEVFGATNPLVLAYILQDLGFRIFSGKDHRKDVVREQLKRSKNALLCANHQLQAWHCWRFESVVDDDSVSAMNPGFFLPTAKIETLTIDDLIKWDYSFILVSQ